MLPLAVRAYLVDLLQVYSRRELENLVNKFGIECKGISKFEIAKNFLSKLPEGRESELIEKVISKVGRRGEFRELIRDFERALSSELLWEIDARGKVSPLVEPLIKPDVDKEKGSIERKMEEFNFQLAKKEFKDALNIYKISYQGSFALFRNSLQELVEEIIRRGRMEPPKKFEDATAMLTEIGVLKKLEKKEESNAVYALFKMLSHYGSHPQEVTDEVAIFMYLWIISLLSFLLKRYEISAIKSGDFAAGRRRNQENG